MASGGSQLDVAHVGNGESDTADETDVLVAPAASMTAEAANGPGAGFPIGLHVGTATVTDTDPLEPDASGFVITKVTRCPAWELLAMKPPIDGFPTM